MAKARDHFCAFFIEILLQMSCPLLCYILGALTHISFTYMTFLLFSQGVIAATNLHPQQLHGVINQH